MGAYDNLDVAVAGLAYGWEDDDVSTGVAQEAINFGAPVFGYEGEEDKVYNAHRDYGKLVLDADLVTSNVYTITINGEAVATTFNTDHDTTMDDIITNINGNATVQALPAEAELDAGDTDNRTVIVKGKGVDITVSGAVTLGASQAAVTVTHSIWSKFLGVAQITAKSTRTTGSTTSVYEQYDSVNIRESGQIYIDAVAGVEDKEAAYVIYAIGADQGKFTNSSSGTYDTKAKFRSNVSDGLARVELRGLN